MITLRRGWAPGRSDALTPVVILAAAAALGAVVAYAITHDAWLPLAVVGPVAAGSAAIVNWHRGLHMILLYLPVQGLVADLLDPNPIGVLLSDGLLTCTYVGFLLAMSRQPGQLRIPRRFLAAALPIVGLCLAEAFNSDLKNPLIALVGFRVMLFNLPLFVVGLTLAQSNPRSLDRLAWLVLLTALPTCLFGLWEWLTGPSAVAALGSAFAETIWVITPEWTGDFIFRPTSTFSFVRQYSEYLLFTCLIAFGALHAATRRRATLLAAALFGLVLIGVLTAAGRTVWLQLPIAALTIYIVVGVQGLGVGKLLMGAVALVAALLFGSPLLADRLPGLTPDFLLWHLLQIIPISGSDTWTGALVGHGTGSALGATRYVNGGLVPPQFESGWGMPLYMFGVLGVAGYVFLHIMVLLKGWHGQRALVGRRRWLGASILSYLVVNAIVGPVFYSPANIFFWLFAGLLAGQDRPLPQAGDQAL